MSKESSSASQTISLPKGGGALSGLGEKFAPDLHTGTGNFSVPIAPPPGRNGFQPQLNLAYSTGNGNGPFGLGWSLSVPGVSRKTSHGIPLYNEHAATDDSEKDVFLLSGSEDLVRVAGDYPGRVRYRPRTEGLFARIEHVRDETNNYWEVRTKDGLLSRYGTKRLPTATGGDPAVTRDPSSENPARIFCWKLTETRDPFGNVIVYEYLRDSGEEPGHRWDQPLLQRIKYADYGDPANPSFLVQVEFVYERRPDPFSEYRSGFEIRTTLRCHKIVISTHTADGVVHKVREYHLIYEQDPHNGVSLLSRLEVFGFNDAGTISDKPVLPPLTYGYSRFEPGKRQFKSVTGQALPLQSVSDPDLDFVDLHGNGLPDLVQMNGVVRYWRNLGDGQFDWPRPMQDAPPHGLSDPGVQFIDANGDGRVDLLVTAAPLSGYYPMNHAPAWDRKSFRPYAQAPTISFEDPEVKLLDLDGDGITDVLRSGSRFECFFNDPDPRRAWQRTAVVERQDLDRFPNVNFSDLRVHLADMTGDGLQDIAVVHDGNIEYWPNLGHGKWGPRIRMRRSPRFPYGYDPKHILLGDVDGDGLADLVYVDHGRVLLWINQSGNAWSEEPIIISGTPPMANTYTVRLIDLEGTGVSGLLWSRDANGSTRDHLRFLDFTGGSKPYLLNRMNDNMGAETRVEYRPSTQDYLRDRQKPQSRWRTPLPFPVQVVAKVEVIDRLSRGKLTTEYRYHHGYWDGAEREFRGFGMVEQLDTETFEDYNAPGLHGSDVAFDNFSTPSRQKQFSPPTLTKTWFHQGPVGEEFGDWHELDYSREFWPDDPPALYRPHELAEWLDQLPRRAKRDALRTLRGHVVRTELYALDDTERENRPYTVTEAVFGLREEAPPGAGEQSRRRIFFPFALAQRTTQWERGDDPMTQLSFVGDYDAYGQPRKQLAVAVPRGRKYRVESNTAEPYLATFSETIHAQRDDSDHYMIDRVAQATSYEVINGGQETPLQLWKRTQAGQATLSLTGLSLQYYDGAPFEGLPFQQLGDYGALVRTESLVTTEEILRKAYRTGDEPPNAGSLPPYLNPNGPPAWTDEYPAEFRTQMSNLAGYVYHRGGEDSRYITGYYVTADRRRYDFHEPGGKGRGLVKATRDPLGREATIEYDAPYDLLPIKTVDPIGLKITARHNYRVLQPESVTDPNGNTARVTFTALGLVNASYVQGKAGEGDQTRPSTRLEYDLLAFMERGQPVSVRTIRHIHHDTETDVPEPKRHETIESVEYSDGFGRLLQARAQAEDVLFGDSVFGQGGLPVDVSVVPGEAVGRKRQPGDPPNVVVSGWQVYDNKGQVVEKYEPFYAKGWDYAPPADSQMGQKVKMFYDPRGQVIRTVNPDGSEQLVIYGIPADPNDPTVFTPTPWEAYTYDVNDNAGRTHAATAAGYRTHWNTPASIVIDPLGRTVSAVARNGPDPSQNWYTTRSTYDIRGNLLTVIDALGRVAFRHVYDLANRPLRVDSIDAGVRRTVLDALGNEVERRDGKGALILRVFDKLNRPTRLWARDESGSPVSLRQILVYGDGGDVNQPEAERQANRAANRLGKLFQHYDEAGLQTFEAYDFKSNVLEKVRQVIGDAPILRVFEAAPANGWRVSAFRVEWQPGVGETLADRALSLLDPSKYQTSFRFDALNRAKSMQYPQDVEGRRRVLKPEYNRAGELEQVRLDDAVYVERIAYNAKGQRTLIAYGNGVMTRYAYDPLTFRLRRLRSERYSQPQALTYSPTGATLQDFGYDYDLAGNITVIQDRAPESGILNNPQAATVADPVLAQLLVSGNALIRQFEYDPIYRLHSTTGRECDLPAENPPWTDHPRCTDLTRSRAYTERYRYDAMGNMLRLEHRNGEGGFTREFTVETTNNRLRRMQIGVDGYNYTFDASGNMQSETTSRHFEWNHADQMKTFRTQTEGAEPSVHAHYLYDAAGQRVKKLVRKQGGQAEVTHYIDGVFEHHRWERQPQAGENNHLHVMDDTQRIALVRLGPAHPDDRGPAAQFHFGDHLGSSNVVVDSGGGLVNREEFTPYGETSFGSFARKRYRFTGKERDEESGMNYHGARYYVPGLTRWISCDPVGIAGGLNSYTYVRNNPLCLIDHFGMQPENLPQDAQGNYLVPGETIEIHDTAPRPDERLIYVLSQEKYEKQESRNTITITFTTGPYQPTWAELGFANMAEVDAQEAQAKAQATQANREKAYERYKRGKAAEWEKSSRIMEAYSNVGSAIPGVYAMGAFAAAYPAQFVVGALLAGSTSEGDFSGCGALAGLGGPGLPRGPALPRPPAPTPAAKVIAGFNSVESGVIHEARGILASAEMAEIRAAHSAGKPLSVNIGGRLIQYEPGLPASGMTMFGENGFIIGREAFVSAAELQTTVLHELYRLATSASASGVSRAIATQETKAAFDFAARAAKLLGGN